MDRITRKSLKQDRFATEVTESVEYLAEHRRQAILYGGIAVVVLALGFGIYFYRQYHNRLIHDALARALETYRALVSDQDVPGRITFRTEQEKDAQALHQFEAVDRDYHRSPEAQIARYYIGVVYYDMGRTADAEKQLERVANEGQGAIPSLAKFTLAEVYLAEGKDEEARKIYEFLLKNPTELVPETRVQLAMARYLRNKNPQEARNILLQLVKNQGAVSGAAANMLRDLGAQ